MTRPIEALTLGTITLLLIGGCTHSDQAPRESVEPAASVEATPGRAEVRRIDFQMTYQLDGISETGQAVGLVSDPNLTLKSAPADGTAVGSGDTLGQLVPDPDVLAALDAGAAHSRLDAQDAARLRKLKRPLASPVSGIIERDHGRVVVVNSGVDVVVELSPIQELRYRSTAFDGKATIETVVGVRTVECEAIWIDSSAGGSADADAESSQGHHLHCRLPRQTETTGGLRAQLDLTSVVMRDAIVVPNVALGYDPSSDGYVVTLDQVSGEEVVPVDVGPTDGVVRVVTSSLPLGTPLVIGPRASE